MQREHKTQTETKKWDNRKRNENEQNKKLVNISEILENEDIPKKYKRRKKKTAENKQKKNHTKKALPQNKNISMIDYGKPGGWVKYKIISNKYASEIRVTIKKHKCRHE